MGHGPRKFTTNPYRRFEAIRGQHNRGPCWGYFPSEMCFHSNAVLINPGGAFIYNGIQPTFYSGHSDFYADDLEVFAISGAK